MNKVLGLDEVLMLSEGTEVWVEVYFPEEYTIGAGKHKVHLNRANAYVELMFEDGWVLTAIAGNPDNSYGTEFRVWLKEPTEEELSKYPWRPWENGGAT